LCNGLGIEVGKWLCNVIKVKTFHWIYDSKGNYLSRLAVLVKPNTWHKYEWNMFSSVQRYSAVVFYIIYGIVVQNINFFLKFLLWIPASHTILTVRILFIGISGFPVTSDFYFFIMNDHTRLNPTAWVSFLTTGLEVGLIVKWGWNVFREPIPRVMIVFW